LLAGKLLAGLHWLERQTFEKLFRVAQFVGFLVAGLSRVGQNIWWLTDEDEIVANEQRLQAAMKFLAGASTRFVTHCLGSLRCMTDACDGGTGFAKDLTSIPDLVAGALAEAWNKSAHDGTLPKVDRVRCYRQMLRQKH